MGNLFEDHPTHTLEHLKGARLLSNVMVRPCAREHLHWLHRWNAISRVFPTRAREFAGWRWRDAIRAMVAALMN